MLVQCTGPPGALRPHVRAKRRLEMDKVRASELRRGELKAEQERRLQADYAAIEEAEIKRKRGDEALDRFVAALLFTEWPQAEPMSEPAAE